MLFALLLSHFAAAAILPVDLAHFAEPLGATVEFVKTPSNSTPTDHPTDDLVVKMLKEYQNAVHGPNSVYALGTFNVTRAADYLDFVLSKEFQGNVPADKTSFAHAQLVFLDGAHSLLFGSDGDEEDVLLVLAFRTGGIFRIKFPAGKGRPSANPCLADDGTAPSLCIMRADRFVESDPFIKHRSCAVTENAVIEVDIDNHAIRKTVTRIDVDFAANFAQTRGVPVPAMSKQRLINYWKVLDTFNNAPTDRLLLRSRHLEGGKFVTDAEDNSSSAQALLRLLDQKCPGTEN